MLVIECDGLLVDFGGQPVGFDMIFPGITVVDVEERPKVGVHIHHHDCPVEVEGFGPMGPDVGPNRKVTF